MTTYVPDPQIYLKAAEVIRVNGWYQGFFYDQHAHHKRAHCPVCVFGAINIAVAGDPMEGGLAGVEAFEWAEKHGPVTIEKHHTLANWNDEPGRTEAEVLDFLTRAASAAEAAKAGESE